VDEKAVAELRAENAKKTFAWAQTLTDPEQKLMALAEAWAYSPNDEVRKQLDAAAEACARAYADGAKPGEESGRFAEMCVRCGIFDASNPFVKSVAK